jgi:SHS2 domain-containing protein
VAAEEVGFELLDHTADVVLIARGRDVGELFTQAGLGLMACIGELAVDRERIATGRVELPADDWPSLFHDWLGELLFAFEARGQVFLGARFDRLEESGLSAEVQLGRLQRTGSRFLREVKAVTYHQLSVAPGPPIWQAGVVLDI